MVDKDGSQVGVVTKEQAIDMAKAAGVDLVVVASAAKPPVAKLINFATFKYQQKKKDQSGKKSKVEVKELRLTPFIAENDFATRIKKAKEFLEDGHRVKVTVKFVGRQITRREFGDQILERVKQVLADVAAVDQEPKLQGKMLSMSIKPIKKSK